MAKDLRFLKLKLNSLIRITVCAICRIDFLNVCDHILYLIVFSSCSHLSIFDEDNTTDANGKFIFESLYVHIYILSLISTFLLYFVDIMLVKLRGPSGVTPQQVNFDPLFPADGTDATVIGYGATVEGGKVVPNLQEADIPIVPYDQCDSFWNKLDEATQICTGTFLFYRLYVK